MSDPNSISDTSLLPPPHGTHHRGRGLSRTAMLCTSWLLWLAACSGSPPRVTLRPQAAKLAGIAVTEIHMPEGSPDYDGAKRTQDVLNKLWTATPWFIFGPKDFQVLKPKSDEFIYATDLLVRSKQLALDANALSVLKISVGTREASGSSIASGPEKRVARHYKRTIAISLTLQDMQGQYIAEIEHLVEVDPFAPKPDWDTTPELRAGLEHVIQTLAERCSDWFTPSWRPEYSLIPSPGVLLDATDSTGQSLRSAVTSAGPVDGDQLLLKHLQYLAPDITVQRARSMLTVPTGACYGDDAPAPWLPGDCVSTIGGHAISGIHGFGLAMGRRLAARRATDPTPTQPDAPETAAKEPLLLFEIVGGDGILRKTPGIL